MKKSAEVIPSKEIENNIKLWLQDHHYDGALQRIYEKFKGKYRKSALAILRDAVIWELLEESRNKILSGDANEYLDSILEYGFIGYYNFTNSELRDEYYAIFGDRQ